MPRMSSLDKIAMVRTGIGNPATGEVSDEMVARYIWLAEQSLAQQHEIQSLTTYEDITTDGTNTDYTLTTANVLRLLYPANNVTNNYPITMKDERWDRQIGMYTGTGGPFFIVPLGTDSDGYWVVRFRPTPGAGIVCRVPIILTPTMPGWDEDSENFSDLPEHFEMTGISTAIEIGLELTNQREDADGQMQRVFRHEGRSSRSQPASFHKHRLRGFQDRLRRRW